MRELVDTLLGRLSLGPLTGTTEQRRGRNANITGTTACGREIFVKRIHHDSQAQFERSLEFERRAGTSPARPTLIGHDEEHHVLVFDHVGPSRSGFELVRDDAFTAAMAGELGQELASMHALELDGVPSPMHPSPPTRYFEEIPLGAFLNMSAAEAETWQILQRDDDVRAAVVRIREVEAAADYAPVYMHGDLRLDQVMVCDDGRLLLSDFEDARAGDPARDLGGLIGDLLFFAILTIPKRLHAADTLDAPRHDDVMRAGGEALDEAAPIVRAFLDGYRRDQTLEHATAVRVMRFAGWHMFDRMFATAESTYRLDGAIRAAAGIGRNLLIEPAAYVEYLTGLDESGDRAHRQDAEQGVAQRTDQQGAAA